MCTAITANASSLKLEDEQLLILYDQFVIDSSNALSTATTLSSGDSVNVSIAFKKQSNTQC
jgi:hypothetical protein